MIQPRLFVCSSATVPTNHPLRAGRHVVELATHGSNANVDVRLEDVARVFLQHLSPRLRDLLEIAAYVFVADAATRRGTQWGDDGATEPWGRDLRFVIPVREVSFWSREDVSQILISILGLLSDDTFSFEFQELQRDWPTQEYLQLGTDENWPFYGVDRVLMFSGGLDSLAGAVETAANGSPIVLVSHRPVSTMDSRQRRLFAELRNLYPNRMIHVPVWVNKQMNLGREHTQRTRSFLFGALGAVVAESVNAGGVRFFENGIVSLNLPVADEVLRARASRTTHPEVLEGMSRFYGFVTQRDFLVDNPYVFKTKAEVVSILAERGAAQFIPHTSSCAHGLFKSKSQWHCGTCSQCIDRRVAILAAGQEHNDLETDYVSDVFTGPRKVGQERNMAVDYARHAIELDLMSEIEIASRFNLELSRAARFLPRRAAAAQQFVAMHKRHGATVKSVINSQLQRHADRLLEGRLEPSSMLAMVAGQQHVQSSWMRYAERIRELLSNGLPTACKTHKPKDEPHLQEICDGILKGNDTDLVREFPFMRWSSSLTKPDWSVEPLRLWVELKYVRKRADIRPITTAIAEDITKYGDNERRVLYVVYDPTHLITDEKQSSAPFVSRPGMMIRFIR